MKILYDYNSRRLFYRQDSKEPTNWKTKKITGLTLTNFDFSIFCRIVFWFHEIFFAVSDIDEECGLVQQELFVYDDIPKNKKHTSPHIFLKCFVSVFAVLALIFTILVWTFSISNNIYQERNVKS